MREKLPSLHEQLAAAQQNLSLIRERKTQYVFSEEIPLQLIKNERELEQSIADIQARIAVLGDGPCPYRGLSPFEAEHADVYFGRETLVKALVHKVEQSSFTLVVGPSGSGKSSLVRAGLIHALDHGGERWVTSLITPGRDPLGNLAAQLVDWLYPQYTEVDRLAEITKLTDYLHDQSLQITQVLARVVEKRRDHRFLLLIDQFEELFTQSASEVIREHVIAMLAEVAAMGDQVRVVIAMRADFYEYVLRDRRLAEAANTGLFNVSPLKPDELRAAITCPAEATGREFEDGLVDRIIASVEHAPGNLPLLQFALTQLWIQQTGEGVLTHQAYAQIGGVEQALTKYAEEEIFDHLSEVEKVQVRRVLIQMVRPVEGTQYIRRLATRDEIGPQDWHIVILLADKRLVVTQRVLIAQAEVEVAEIAHEALIRGWERLQEWMKSAHDFREWQERLRVALSEWERNPQDQGGLLRGARLREAESWLTERALELSPREHAFIRAGVNLRDRERITRERRRRWTLGGLVAATMIFALLAGIAYTRGEAARQAEADTLLAKLNAIAGLSARQSGLLQGQSAKLVHNTLGLAAEAMRRFSIPSLEVDEPLRYGLSLLPKMSGRVHHESYVVDVAFSPDGKYLATASEDKFAIISDTKTGAPLAKLQHEAPVRTVLFDARSTYLATTSWYADQQAHASTQVWDVSTGKKILYIDHEAGRYFVHMAFSPDGRYIAAALGPVHNNDIRGLEYEDDSIARINNDDGNFQIWDVPHNKKVMTIQYKSLSENVLFSPDSQYVGVTSEDDEVFVWNITSGKRVFEAVHNTLATEGIPALTASGNYTPFEGSPDLRALAISHDGKYLATGSTDGLAIVWDIHTGEALFSVKDFPAGVTDITFNHDGNIIALADADTLGLVFWKERKGIVLPQAIKGEVEFDAYVNTVVFSPDGKYIAATSDDYTARVWELSANRVVGEVARIVHDDKVNAVAFSPDGKYIATASDDKTAQIREAVAHSEISSIEYDDLIITPAFNSDGKYLATVDNEKISVWHTDKNSRVITVTGDFSETQSLSISSDGKYVAAIGVDRKAYLWETATGHAVGHVTHSEISTDTDTLTSVAFSPDGTYVATSGDDRTVRLWDTKTRAEVKRMEHDSAIISMAFSPDGRYVATGTLLGGSITLFSPDNTSSTRPDHIPAIYVWDIASGRQIAHMRYNASVNAVAFSPDGKYLATVDGKLVKMLLFEPNVAGQNVQLREVAHVEHEDTIFSVIFSADGRYLATGSRDRTARIWSLSLNGDTSSMQEVARINHSSSVLRVAFSPDGKQLVTAAGNAARRWALDPKDLLDEACTRLSRNFTLEEWQRYIPNEPYRKTCPNLPD